MEAARPVAASEQYNEGLGSVAHPALQFAFLRL